VAISKASKVQLRTEIREDRAFKDQKVSWRHILNSEEFASARTIASYLSYGTEPTTVDLNEEIIKSGRSLLLPRVLKDNDLEWVAWDGNASSLAKKGKIQEPVGAAISEPEIDLIIVPTLCADGSGTRLGQGGGSYDRALPKLKAWRIGLIYAGELSNTEIPYEAHDVKLNAVATPDLIVRFN
jgi:5-formyltetrahydrofolate cyclo-ligase